MSIQTTILHHGLREVELQEIPRPRLRWYGKAGATLRPPIRGSLKHLGEYWSQVEEGRFFKQFLPGPDALSVATR
jgi:hypothetical protein